MVVGREWCKLVYNYLVKNLCRSAGINLVIYHILLIIKQITLRNFYQWMVCVKF